MKINKILIPKPEIPIVDYQYISFFMNLKLNFSNSEYRPIIFHTRNYAFSSSLAPAFKSPKKLYTRFNIFYLHCSLLYQKLSFRKQKIFDKEIEKFNKH
jgi:hypothetical protein